jgi:hypothetical protein
MIGQQVNNVGLCLKRGLHCRQRVGCAAGREGIDKRLPFSLLAAVASSGRSLSWASILGIILPEASHTKRIRLLGIIARRVEGGEAPARVRSKMQTAQIAPTTAMTKRRVM